MREQTRVAADACLDALTTPYTAQEQERVSRPPYPLPDRLIAHRNLLLAEIERLGREGSTEHTCVRHLSASYPAEWTQLADSLRRDTTTSHGGSLFLTGLILVFSASEMTAEEFDAGIARVPDGLTRECLRAHLVHVLVETGEVARAEQACEAIEPLHGVDRRYLGYRIVARWFAQRCGARFVNKGLEPSYRARPRRETGDAGSRPDVVVVMAGLPGCPDAGTGQEIRSNTVYQE